MGSPHKCFPDSSVGKESACNAGDPGSIPGLGRSAGEGKGYPLVFWPGEFHGLHSPWGPRVGHDWATYKIFSWMYPELWLRCF